MMKISLIMATIGRTQEVKRFLEHLTHQSYRQFELIVVDQNPDDRLVPILDSYKGCFDILHLRTLRTGVSRARNIGLRHATGEVVSFPDDDCWYPPNVLEEVARFFLYNPAWDGLTGRAVDERGLPSVGRWDKREGMIDRFNVWTRSVEFSIFVRKAVAEEIGGFDEELGPGAGTPWGAHEGDDFILRALKAGFRFFYNPQICIYHPQPIQSYDAKALQRAKLYGQGMGRVLRKHKYPTSFLLYSLSRTFAGMAFSLLTGNVGAVRFRWASIKGRILGWLSEP